MISTCDGGCGPVCGCETGAISPLIVDSGCDFIGGCDSIGSCGYPASCDCGGCSAGGLGVGAGGGFSAASGSRLWASTEYLGWWLSGMETPPLIATAPAGTARGNTALNVAGQTVVGGTAGDLVDDYRSGFRLRVGAWQDLNKQFGIEGEYVFLEDASDFFQRSAGDSVGSTIFTRPFFNALTNQQDTELVSFPGIVAGTATVTARSDFESAGIRVVGNLCQKCECYGSSRLDIMFGYRYAGLKESLVITEDLQPTDGGSFAIADSFRTSNRFNGGEVGFRWHQFRSRYDLQLLAKLAFGTNSQNVTIRGTQTTIDGQGLVDNFDAGFFALSSNSGSFSRDEFALIPELGATLGVRLGEFTRLQFGYSLIYWDRVVRPGEHIDLAINPNLAPPPVSPLVGPLRPEFRFDDTSVVAHGFNIGLLYNF